MAFAALVAHRAIVRMVDHQPFDHAGAEFPRFRIVDRDARAVRSRRHAGHDQVAMRVFVVFELLHGALTAGAHRAQGRMPAEVGQVEPKRETGLEQVLTV